MYLECCRTDRLRLRGVSCIGRHTRYMSGGTRPTSPSLHIEEARKRELPQCLGVSARRRTSAASRTLLGWSPQDGRVGGKEVERVEVGTLRTGHREVLGESGGEPLSVRVSRHVAVVIGEHEFTAHDEDEVRSGVGVPQGRLSGREREVLEHGVRAVRRLMGLVNASTEVR